MRRRRPISLIFLSLAVVSLAGCESFSKSALSKNAIFGLGRKRDERLLNTDESLDPLGRRNADRLLLDDLGRSQIATTWKVKTFSGEDRRAAAEFYGEGVRKYQRAVRLLELDPADTEHIKLFEQAANEFRIAGSRWPDSALQQDALFFEGESYFFANRYVQSNRAFEKLIANYSGSRFLDKAQSRRFAIAHYWLEMAKNKPGWDLSDPQRPKTNLAGEARRILHRIRIDDPTGKLADDAALALGNAFFEAKRYYEAADTYEDLRLNYPGSKHQFHAHLLELKARLLSYRGKSYDQAPLEKADKLMKAIVSQFPEQAAQEKEYLAREATSIRNQLAERDWSMAEYFRKRGENRAAKIYYEQVAKNFEDTTFAKIVDQQIAEVGKLPPTPPQYAQWLVDLFPDPDAAKPIIAAGDNESIYR